MEFIGCRAGSRHLVKGPTVPPVGEPVGTSFPCCWTKPPIAGHFGSVAKSTTNQAISRSRFHPSSFNGYALARFFSGSLAHGNGPAPQSDPLQGPISVLGSGTGKSLEVLYAGDAPGLVAGVTQVNFRLPAVVDSFGSIFAFQMVQLQCGDAVSPPVTIAVSSPQILPSTISSR